MEKNLENNMPPGVHFEGAIVVGSLDLVAFAEKYGLELPDDIVVGDTDLCVRPEVLQTLRENGWHENTYRGVTTLRDKPDGEHRYDVGTGAFVWTYDEIIELGYTLEHDGDTYLDPLRTLKWYLALNRKKDQPRIRFLAQQVLPAWLAAQQQD